MDNLTIGGLAKTAGVHVETVRYYQHRGLLNEPRRPIGSVRRYGESAVKRLRFIRRAQELGFTLEEIKTLLRLSETPSCRGARTLAAKKLEVVRSRLDDLNRMQAALEGWFHSATREASAAVRSLIVFPADIAADIAMSSGCRDRMKVQVSLDTVQGYRR